MLDASLPSSVNEALVIDGDNDSLKRRAANMATAGDWAGEFLLMNFHSIIAILMPTLQP